MAQDVLARLFANLQKTNQVYSQLLQVAQIKQKHLIQNDIEALRDDLQQEEKLAGEGAVLNGQRVALDREARAHLKVQPGAETLGALCAAMPQVWKDRYQKERQSLRETLEHLAKVNRTNVALVNNSLEVMKGLLSALFGAESVAAYGRNGIRASAEMTRRALDARA